MNMNTNLKNVLIFNFKIIFPIFFILTSLIAFPTFSYTQTDSSNTVGKIKPVTPLNNFIKYSNATAKNNLNYNGQVNGFYNGISNFIKDFNSQETFTFETGIYDSIQFYFDLPNSYVDKFFIKVFDNEPFTFLPIPVLPVIESDGLNMVIKSVAKSKGKKLYELKISDDVDPKHIEVKPLEESIPFIYIEKGDSATYYIFLKKKDEFNNNVSTELLDKIKKGQEVIIPIGVAMKDKFVSSDVQEYKQYLKKKKKIKPKT